MKKAELHNLVLETLDEYIKEAELSTGDNTFTIKVTVNKNPTKEGIKIQLVPKGGTVLNTSDEKGKVSEIVQKALNKALGELGSGLQVSIDPDVKQTDLGPNALSYFIPINQLKSLIVNALNPQGN